MKYDPNRHHRRSIRLKGYDYTQAGAYFVTICTQHRQCLFGEILDTSLQLNSAGQMVAKWWGELSNKFPFIETNEYVVMPNHFHGIIVIGDDLRNVGVERVNIQKADISKRPDIPKRADIHKRPDIQKRADTQVCPYKDNDNGNDGVRVGLFEIVQWFKTMTTNDYIRGVKQRGWTAFSGKLWQRNYYEHIIRNEESLEILQEYIVNNPCSWQEDSLHPNNPSKW